MFHPQVLTVSSGLEYCRTVKQTRLGGTLKDCLAQFFVEKGDQLRFSITLSNCVLKTSSEVFLTPWGGYSSEWFNFWNTVMRSCKPSLLWGRDLTQISLSGTFSSTLIISWTLFGSSPVCRRPSWTAWWPVLFMGEPCLWQAASQSTNHLSQHCECSPWAHFTPILQTTHPVCILPVCPVNVSVETLAVCNYIWRSWVCNCVAIFKTVWFPLRTAIIGSAGVGI